MGLIEEIFAVPKALVGMVHVPALPGTPLSALPIDRIVDQAVQEAAVLTEAGFHGLILENMHDRPYLNRQVGPEIVAAMTRIGLAVRREVPLPLGIQVLAAANREALAVALACGAVFIRAENFVFAHVADEGLMDEAEAGPLLRYRRELEAEHIRVFADVKKKHAAHALTADVGLAETARAAAFCGADAVVVSGSATGEPTAVGDVRVVRAAVELPVAVGSGITPENLAELWDPADVFIIGSFLKRDGLWHEPVDPPRARLLVEAARRLADRA